MTASRTWQRVGLRAALLVAAAAGLAVVRIPHRPATLCLLRALTGIPCPFCGGTTAAVQAGHLHLAGALRASPLAVLGALAVATAPVTKITERWLGLSGRARVTLVVAVLLTSELWQLARFGVLTLT